MLAAYSLPILKYKEHYGEKNSSEHRKVNEEKERAHQGNKGIVIKRAKKIKLRSGKLSFFPRELRIVYIFYTEMS